MDPYEAEAGKIPPTDLYYDLPLYGRYNPSPQDFNPLEEHCNSNTQEALQYWTGVVEKCDATCYVYQNPFGGRDVFALGSIIVKSCHLGTRDAGAESSRDYSIADKNEVAAIQLVPKTVPVPRILFSGKVKIISKASDVYFTDGFIAQRKGCHYTGKNSRRRTECSMAISLAYTEGFFQNANPKDDTRT